MASSADPHETEAYRVLLDTVANVIVRLRADGTVVEWNRAAEELFGLRRDEVVGTDYVETVIPPEQRATVRADITKVLAGTPTHGFENEAVLPDGRRRTLIWNVTRVLGPTGAPEGVFAVGQDITARAVVDRRNRMMFERSADGIIFMRTPSGTIECNPAAVAMLGLRSAEELRGRHLREFSPPLQPDGEPSAEKSARMDRLASESGFHRFEWTHLDVNGAPLPVEVSLSYLGEDGSEPLFLVTWHDLRPQKRAEAERQALEARLRHAERLEVLGRFAGGIAHDFNNLLTVVEGNVALLREELGDALRDAPEVEGSVAEIADATDRARALVAQVLAFSRQQPRTPTRVVVADLLQNMGKLLRRVIGEEIALEIRPAAPTAAVRADRSQLEQVFLNLAVNARDAMLAPSGGAPGGVLRLEVDLADLTEAEVAPFAGAGAGRWVRVRVSDTGHGMNAETLARAFEPFFTTKDVGRGTGLGLSTVFGIVQQAGGTVRAESTVGGGTTVSVLLPPLDEIEAPPARRDQAPSRFLRAHTARLLVVEDDEMVRATTLRILERAGYEVDAASDGLDGLERWSAAGGAYDLVLTDVRMPALGGVELAKRLAQDNPDLPVLFMTGYAEDELDPDLVLQKPFGPQQLVEAIAAALERRAARAEG